MSFSLTTVIIVPRKLTIKDSHVQISKQLFTDLHLTTHQELSISIGQKTLTVSVQTVDMDDNEIHLPEQMLHAFCLPIQRYKFQALASADTHTLKLGPVIGLLTDSLDYNHEDPHFRSIHLFCEELHHGITAQGGFFFVFPYDKFLSQGYFLNNGKWILTQVPIPDVIYNRIHSRVLEQKKPYKQFRKKIDQFMIPFFNDRFLSKWEVYEQLQNEDLLLAYLPNTKIFSLEHLYDFVREYETVFLKPIHGSQGRNIIKIKKETDDHYSFESSLPSLRNHSGENYSFTELAQQIQPFMEKRMYLIQQGIALVSPQSSAMDFRVLCHKNSQHHWTVTSTVARIAAEQEFVSNLARGGTMTRPLLALRTCMSDKQSLEVLALMKELALATATAIDKHSDGMTGELGIDIGVDQEGKPWLIEVNSKPSKNFEDGLGKIRPSAKAIIQYCTILAFKKEKKEEL
ncbi:YheC/YheD family endospore coat-associated protein [Neobacillus jeddahensis]|uniref:YheC/YheD family endospore coat-associated protein n=1 Tax=Neobacillus jeddahensis TaxID=1461580 RepID=UPI00058AD716|nr:YheC/YheD family protein [Neobacillus jeddahensis]